MKMCSVRKELDLAFFPVMAVIYLLKAPADVEGIRLRWGIAEICVRDVVWVVLWWQIMQHFI